MPTLPGDLAHAVQEHFQALSNWLETVLTKGSQLGVFRWHYSARREAESLVSTVCGAMLIARAYASPRTFPEIIELALKQLLGVPKEARNDRLKATADRGEED